jgi:hypothetical protein
VALAEMRESPFRGDIARLKNEIRRVATTCRELPNRLLP